MDDYALRKPFQSVRRTGDQIDRSLTMATALLASCIGKSTVDRLDQGCMATLAIEASLMAHFPLATINSAFWR